MQRILRTTGRPCNESATAQREDRGAGPLRILGALWDSTSASSRQPDALTSLRHECRVCADERTPCPRVSRRDDLGCEGHTNTSRRQVESVVRTVFAVVTTAACCFYHLYLRSRGHAFHTEGQPAGGSLTPDSWRDTSWAMCVRLLRY